MPEVPVVIESATEVEVAVTDPIYLDVVASDTVYISAYANSYMTRRIYVQTTKPSSPIEGDLWIDTSV